MTDFELGKINACHSEFSGIQVHCCFFHLGRCVHRKKQNVGLQIENNDLNDRTIKEYTHMLLPLTYIPWEHVKETFTLLPEEAPEKLEPILTYFNEYYVNGKVARGRRKAIAPRYSIPTYNQYEVLRIRGSKTNNYNDGFFHNRLMTVVSKPS